MSEETKFVLQMLSEGKITADEAANLIRVLGEKMEKEPKLEQSISLGTVVGDIERRARLQAKVVARRTKERLRDEVREAKDVLKEHIHEAKEMVRENSNHGGVWGILGNLFDGLQSPNFSWNETMSGEVVEGSTTKIIIDGVNGRIEVGPSPDASWRLEIEKCVYARDKEEAEEKAKKLYTVESGEKVLRISAKQVFGQRSIVHFRLLWPESRPCDLELSSVNGSVRVSLPKFGSVRISTTNGKVELQGEAEKAELSSTNGRVMMVGCAADITASTVNGGLRVLCPVPRAGVWQLSSVNGSVKVHLGESAELGTKIALSNAHGGLTCELPGHEVERQHSPAGFMPSKKLVATRRGEFAKWLSVTAKSVNGRVRVEPYSQVEEDI